MTQVGAGTTTLTGTNTYTGATTISAGSCSSATAARPAVWARERRRQRGVDLQPQQCADLGGAISGTGSVTKAGTGTTTLTGANTYTGGTTISAGTLQVGNGGTTGSIVGDVIDNGGLTFNRSDAVTFGGVISGTGTLTKAGTGTTTLTGANSYSGTTTISAGTLQVGMAAPPASWERARRRQRGLDLQPQRCAHGRERHQRTGTLTQTGPARRR